MAISGVAGGTTLLTSKSGHHSESNWCFNLRLVLDLMVIFGKLAIFQHFGKVVYNCTLLKSGSFMKKSHLCISFLAIDWNTINFMKMMFRVWNWTWRAQVVHHRQQCGVRVRLFCIGGGVLFFDPSERPAELLGKRMADVPR